MKYSFLKYSLLIFFFSICSVVSAQVSTKSKFYLYMGNEYNIFQSPDTFYDYISHVAYSKDQLVRSDFFTETGIRFELNKKFKSKVNISLGADISSKNYFREKILNSGNISPSLNVSYKLSKKINLGLKIEYEKRKLFDSDILGTETKYVFAYKQLASTFFLKLKPFKNNNTELSYQYFSKDFNPVGDIFDFPVMQSRVKLDNNQNLLEIRSVQKISKRCYLMFKSSVYSREYQFLSSTDSLYFNNDSVKRHYQNLSLEFDFNYKLNNYLKLEPYLRYGYNKDLYNDYYTYERKEGGLEMTLYIRKVEFNLKGWYNSINYKKCEAPQKTKPYPSLMYQYYYLKTEIKFKFRPGADLFISGIGVERQSNSTRVTLKYRRGFVNYSLMAGINIYPEKFFKRRK